MRHNEPISDEWGQKMAQKMNKPKAKRPISAARKVIIILAALIGLLALALSVHYFDRWYNQQTSPQAEEKIGVSLTGETVCLPKDPRYPVHTLECAIGLKDKDENHYALSDATYDGDFLDTGLDVRVDGVFVPVKDGDETSYDIVGTIRHARVKVISNDN